jgi:single-strand DNA-binding protein
MSLNRAIIMGRLVRDPELRTTQSGVSVASFTLAVDRDVKNQDGSRQADFIDVVAWRQTAEFVVQYLGKGRLVCAEGRLQIRDWTDKDGNKRKTAEIVASSVYPCGKREGDGSKSDTQGMAEGFQPTDEDDGDLPF